MRKIAAIRSAAAFAALIVLATVSAAAPAKKAPPNLTADNAVTVLTADDGQTALAAL